MIQSCKHSSIRCIVLVTLLAAPMFLWALSSDSEQSISFQSDKFEMDDIRKTQTYSGTVVMEQGSMKISADKVVIFRQGNKVSRVIATGRPAHYSQVPEAGKDPIVAQAFRMEYDIDDKTLHLIENASVVQQGTSLSGNRIEYDVKNALVKAEGNLTKGKDDRVRMIIPPQEKVSE